MICLLRPRSIRYPGAALCALAFAGPAMANGCTIQSTGMALGVYQPLTLHGKVTSTDAVSTASVSVSCTGLAAGGGYRITLGPSMQGPGDRTGTRFMANQTQGGDPMAYNIFVDPGRQLIWGDGLNGSAISGTLPAGDSSLQHTVYGRIPAGQSSLRGGSYVDYLTMSISHDP